MAMRLSKKKKLIREKIQAGRTYPIGEAINVLQTFASKKFEESIDVAINLGVDPKKADQAVRSATNLPKGTGREVKVAVFTQGENAKKAKDAGADIVGFEDLADQVKAGDLNFDIVIATPDAMAVVGKLGQILGPRGLMPNPKVGTVTTNVEKAIHDAKSGQIRYRTDKNGIIHCTIGKVKFDANDIIENLSALIGDLKKLKPVSSKGTYIKKVTLSSTMGAGIAIDPSSINV